jgi:hypothetical protein
MRLSLLLAGFALLTLVLAFEPVQAKEGKKKITPTQKWSGKNGNNDASKAAPNDKVITDQKTFEGLWKAWNVKGDAPKIDFAKELVIVQLSLGGPNIPSASYSLNENGDLTSVARSTLIGGPGFGYSLDVLPREGIKTYQGKTIEAK